MSTRSSRPPKTPEARWAGQVQAPRPAASGGLFPGRGEVFGTLVAWAAAIAAAVIAVWASESTSLHQFAIGLSTALVALAVSLGVLDLLSRALAHLLRKH